VGVLRKVFVLWALILLFMATACRGQRESHPDNPRLTPNVHLQDVTFHSASLDRNMPYRVILPVAIGFNAKLPVVYLLHGGGGNYRDWSNYSDVAQYATGGLVLVMPEGESSYYVNAVDRSGDRFEDYITKDLIADVEARFPIAPGRANRAIAGVSMGGFGSVVLSLKHPDLFALAAGLSSAIDVPSRPFSVKRIGQYREHRAIFGPWGGQSRRDNDPYVLAQNADPQHVPYLFLSCGEQEGLLPANRRLASILKKRGLKYEFHSGPGGHDWNQWNRRIPDLFQSLKEHWDGNQQGR
jgi:putative tributyrin esterase